ncbi:hypothetical protein GCM10023322_56680 [Rugosimonospora acidiphila]|uniref:Glucosyl-3-phosphoglycerate synthase n=1 Tax=Rugosimonospora acidiphila TaxID=556531 RepID=A0ABP9SCR7_9ACTN
MAAELTDRPRIDAALGLELVTARTLARSNATVTVLIPAHNESETIADVVKESRRGLELLGVDEDIVVSASGCTDDTAAIARTAGARVIESPKGKGAAIIAGLAGARGDIVCLIDGDVRYFGDPPLVPLLVEPILAGIADACVTDLYWRPVYPQLWLMGFFAPLAGALYPDLLARSGSTPWSGQRAARRELWPQTLPDGFTSDLEILLHWNENAVRLRPVLADDWVNPQRPKPDLMAEELSLVTRWALRDGRLAPTLVPAVRSWFEAAHAMMARYRPGEHDPQEFERQLLRDSRAALHQALAGRRSGRLGAPPVHRALDEQDEQQDRLGEPRGEQRRAHPQRRGQGEQEEDRSQPQPWNPAGRDPVEQAAADQEHPRPTNDGQGQPPRRGPHRVIDHRPVAGRDGHHAPGHQQVPVGGEGARADLLGEAAGRGRGRPADLLEIQQEQQHGAGERGGEGLIGSPEDPGQLSG